MNDRTKRIEDMLNSFPIKTILENDIGSASDRKLYEDIRYLLDNNKYLRETLKIIADNDVICYGPGCHYCEGDEEHPPTNAATIAKEALEKE